MRACSTAIWLLTLGVLVAPSDLFAGGTRGAFKVRSDRSWARDRGPSRALSAAVGKGLPLYRRGSPTRRVAHVDGGLGFRLAGRGPAWVKTRDTVRKADPSLINIGGKRSLLVTWLPATVKPTQIGEAKVKLVNPGVIVHGVVQSAGRHGRLVGRLGPDGKRRTTVRPVAPEARGLVEAALRNHNGPFLGDAIFQVKFKN